MTAPGGVLWITPEVPDRTVGGGGNLHQGRLLVEVARHVPVDLVVAGAVTDVAVRAAVRRLVEVPPAPPGMAGGKFRRRASAAGAAWVRRQPVEVADLAPTRASLAAALGPLVPDVHAVLVHHQGLAPLLQRPRLSGTRWVLSLFHASSERATQAAALSDRPLRRALLRREAANSARVERQAIEAADALVTVTAEDAERLRVPATPTFVVPHGVDVGPLDPLPEQPVVLLAGSLDYEPNVDGVAWFVGAVWPCVRAERPDAQLRIVGRRPPAPIVGLGGRDGVEVHADVPDMAPYLAEARVAVVPLRIGTGVRVKALQALAAGVPVAGTTIGLESTGVGPAEAAVADEPGALATAIVDLLGDDVLAESRRRAGRELVAGTWSWERSAVALLEALDLSC